MTWQNRIVSYGEESPKDIRENPLNWRLHPQHQRQALTGLLDEVGWVDVVIINKTSGLLVDGHLRVEAALARGEATIPVAYVELTGQEEKKVLATLDAISPLVDANNQRLESLLASVQTQSDHLTMLLEDLQPEETVTVKEAREKLQREVKKKETARFMFGPYKFDVPLDSYNAWLDTMRETHGYESADILAAAKEMLGVQNDAAKKPADATGTTKTVEQPDHPAGDGRTGDVDS